MKNKYNIFPIVAVTSFLFLAISSWFYLAPSAIIVPHHNIVAVNRQNFLQTVRLLRPYTKKIILISPDHFSTNQKLISYTDANWNLSNGTIFYDHSFDSSDLTVNNQLLKNDHGIYNILPDIKKLFPKVTVVPILIGQKLSQNELDKLYQKINNYCSWGCLLVASIDFSHYLPASMASAHDSYTLDSLYSKNLNKIFSSEVDSPQSFYLISKFAFDKNNNFNLFDHTNSGYLIKNPDIETTTHLFGLFNPVPSFQKNIVKTTLNLPYQIDQSKNLNSLGIRFFYGFDEVSYDSALQNFTITTSTSNNKVVQSFFPIITQKNITNFIRGDEKTKLIKNYFDSITDKNITKDYFWGTLIYDRKK